MREESQANMNETNEPRTDRDRGHGDTQTKRLLALAEELRLFKTPDGTQYAELPVESGRWETHPVISGAVRDWLTLNHLEAHGSVPSKTALESAMGALNAKARFRSPTHEVYLRVAWQESTLYLDLANEAGDVVRVTADGWDLLNEAPAVHFRRPKAMLELPRPIRGGSLDELRPFVNVGDADWVLTVAWLFGTLHPTGPYPVLALHGEKGSAKSTTTRYLRALVDPSAAPAPVQPRDSDALTLKAHHNWVVAFDNMSSMPRWLSDALCRLATGAGDSKRALYENTEEVIFAAKRPCLINGIEELATAGDLLDRTMIVSLPVISPGSRRSEAELNAAYEEARPRILGALLDAVVVALQNVGQVQLKEAPRMKDFAEWVVSAEQALGWVSGTFMAAYKENQAEGADLELEASQIAQALLIFMEARTTWRAPATELLNELNKVATQHHLNTTYGWPGNPRALSGKLTRLAPALRSVGLEFHRNGPSDGRSISLEWVRAEDASGEGARPEEGTPGEEDSTDAAYANYANITPLPTSNSREEKREGEGRVGNQRKVASVASGASGKVCAECGHTSINGLDGAHSADGRWWCGQCMWTSAPDGTVPF